MNNNNNIFLCTLNTHNRYNKYSKKLKVFFTFCIFTVKISYDHKSNTCERVQGTNCVIVFDTWCYPRFYK